MQRGPLSRRSAESSHCAAHCASASGHARAMHTLVQLNVDKEATRC
jgi:hypothetical protein